MSAKHTPGPWHWVGNTLEPVEKNPNNSAVYSILNAEGGYGFVLSDFKATCAELDADRQLIAAAPELLKALQKMLPLYRKAIGLIDPNTDTSLTIDAHNAIVKATGGQA